MSKRLQELLDKQDIYELCCRYLRALDRLDEALLVSTFWDDAWCDYGFTAGPPADFARFCMRALRHHAANHHMIGNVLVDLEGDEAFGEVYFTAYHKVPEGDAWTDLVIGGRYLDRYERRGGEWRFAYRSEVVDHSHTRPTNDPYFTDVPQSLRGGRRDDAVYETRTRRRPRG